MKVDLSTRSRSRWRFARVLALVAGGSMLMMIVSAVQPGLALMFSSVVSVLMMAALFQLVSRVGEPTEAEPALARLAPLLEPVLGRALHLRQSPRSRRVCIPPPRGDRARGDLWGTVGERSFSAGRGLNSWPLSMSPIAEGTFAAQDIDQVRSDDGPTADPVRGGMGTRIDLRLRVTRLMAISIVIEYVVAFGIGCVAANLAGMSWDSPVLWAFILRPPLAVILLNGFTRWRNHAYSRALRRCLLEVLDARDIR